MQASHFSKTETRIQQKGNNGTRRLLIPNKLYCFHSDVWSHISYILYMSGLNWEALCDVRSSEVLYILLTRLLKIPVIAWRKIQERTTPKTLLSVTSHSSQGMWSLEPWTTAALFILYQRQYWFSETVSKVYMDTNKN